MTKITYSIDVSTKNKVHTVTVLRNSPHGGDLVSVSVDRTYKGVNKYKLIARAKRRVRDLKKDGSLFLTKPDKKSIANNI